MGAALACGFMLLGALLLIIGLTLGGFSLLREATLPAVTDFGFVVGLHGLRKRLRSWRQEYDLRRAGKTESEWAASLTPLLFDDHFLHVIETAGKLSKGRDLSAVPALLRALEYCVNTQRPGWREVAESIVNALAEIGDSRSLPLLYRLENVRGIGFIPAIRNAIAAIEPHSILLRPGSGNDTVPQEQLLRPVSGRYTADEPAVLLRSLDSER